MTEQVKVMDGQSWVDTALLLFGRVEGLSYLLEANDQTLNEELPTGTLMNFEPQISRMERIQASKKEYRSPQVEPTERRIYADQSWLDVALQEYGNIEGALDLLERNNTGLTSAVPQYAKLLPRQEGYAGYFRKKGYLVCTSDAEGVVDNGGTETIRLHYKAEHYKGEHYK